ncbi:MAG: hypothetical protein C0520_00880 [Sphingopyxis sp.]|nr:hypothetical protein [Sphingopyxis sp.]
MLAFATPALADDCRPEFVDTTETVNVSNVEVGLGEFSRENFNIRVRSVGDGPCNARIRFTRLGGASAVDMPPYTLRSGSTILEILSEGAAPTLDSDLIVPNAPTGPQGRAVPFQLTMPSEWGLKAGSFGEQIELTLIDLAGAEVDKLLLTVNVTIPEAVALRVVGATGSNDIARIHLGNLSSSAPTTSDPFGVRIWSTSGYRVALSSENKGQLVHEGNLDRFTYQMFFDGQAVNLTGGDSFVFPEHTPSLGRIHPLRVQTGPVRARAGHYEDRVTVTVTPV